MNKIIYISSKNYEESGYGLELDLLTISYQMHFYIPWQIGYLEKIKYE